MTSVPQNWRFLTPLMLIMLTTVLSVVGFLSQRTLTQIDIKTDATVSSIAGIQRSFQDYQLSTEHRFTVIETDVAYLKKQNNKGGL